MKRSLPGNIARMGRTWLSRPRLGIGVGAAAVRFVLLVDGRVAWWTTEPLGTESPIGEVVDRAFRDMPRQRRMPRVVAAFGPHLSQLKLIRELPRTRHAGLLTNVVRQSVNRYFVTDEGPVVVSPVVPVGEASAWAAAMNENVMLEIREACTAHGMILEAIAPSAVLLSHVAPDAKIHWSDGCFEVVVEREAERLVSVRRLLVDDSSALIGAGRAVTLPGRTTELPWQFADACGAVLAARPIQLSYAPQQSARKWNASRGRTRLMFGVAASALLNLTLGPIVITRASRIAPARVIAASSQTSVEARRIARANARLASELDEIRQFKSRRRSTVALLGVLTDALPDSAYVSALRLNEDVGTLEITAADAASLLRQLQATDSIGDVSIEGSVISQQLAGHRSDRATVRFRWSTRMPSDTTLHSRGGSAGE